MMIIGERINSSRKRIAEAIQEKDAKFIQGEALLQIKAGADYVDVNAGTFFDQEVEFLVWLVKAIQEVTDRPLSIDTASPEAADAALKVHKGKAILNSVTAQKKRLDSFLPLIKEHGCSVVALCQDDSGIPETPEGKAKVASNLIESLVAEGINSCDIYIDPLVHPISADPTSGKAFLDALAEIAESYPGVGTIAGLSNISFGLPKRKLLNRNFLILALGRGLKAAIVDPTDEQLIANILAAQLILGKDEFCMNYLRAYREGRLQV